MGENPYDPLTYQTPQAASLAILPWFKAFCIAMALLYFIVVVVGIVIVVAGDGVKQNPGDPPAALIGGIYSCIGLPLTVAYVAALFLPRRKWVWVFDLVLIALTMTSCCCLPAAIPLLVFWLKAETRTWFGFR